MVPHLITALTGPINELEQRVLDSMPTIERWFRLEWMEHTPPFYAAVDVRNAGFKLSPVSTRLFPTGWNYLTPEMVPLAVQAAMAAIEKICPEARNLLIGPENGTPNSAYLGSIDPALKKPTPYTVPGGEVLTYEPVIRGKRRLGLKDFDPCTILLNNDLVVGVPGILEEIYEQYLLPPLHAGWPMRRKSNHFKAFEEVAKRLGKLMGVDPWLINPLFDRCEEVDFRQPAGLDCLTTQVEAVLGRVRRKYKEYGIKEKPFVVVKPDHGTHPLGVVTVRDARDLQGLRERVQAFIETQPPALPAHDFMVQEGVQTQEHVNNAVAEPVVYTMDRYVVGGFYRVHPGRGNDEALSTAGSGYVPLAFEHSTQLPQLGAPPGISVPNRFYMYGVVARLAVLAASYELEATDPEEQDFA
jgi:glutamate--cysteine ligase